MAENGKTRCPERMIWPPWPRQPAPDRHGQKRGCGRCNTLISQVFAGFCRFFEIKTLAIRLASPGMAPKKPRLKETCARPLARYTTQKLWDSGKFSSPWPAGPPGGLVAWPAPQYNKGMNQSGFSLLGTLAASVIGLVVIMGTTQSFIQQKISLLALEKRIKQLEITRRGDPLGAGGGQQKLMGKAWSCLNTLKGHSLSGGSAKKSFEITAVKDSAAPPATVWDFSKNSAGELTSPAAREKMKSLGIDKFEKLEFVYEPAKPTEGRLVLRSKTVIPGHLERENKPAVWELSGVKVAGSKVTECGGTEPQAEYTPCGYAVEGAYHTNPDGSKGGFVAATATVRKKVFVGKNAAVCGKAQVKGQAKVKGHARILDSARVTGQAEVSAKVFGHAWVKGQAKVIDSAEVSGWAEISEHAEVDHVARVFENAKVSGNAQVSEAAWVFGRAEVKDRALIKGQAKVYGQAWVYGIGNNPWVYGSARVYDNARISGHARIYGHAQVKDSAEIKDNAHVFESAEVSGPKAQVKDWAMDLWQRAGWRQCAGL